MLSGSLPLAVLTLLLNLPNVFRILGLLESKLAGSAALVYLFIMLSKSASIRHRNTESDGRQIASATLGLRLKELQ